MTVRTVARSAERNAVRAPPRPSAQEQQPQVPEERGRRRVVIEGVSPEVDCGRFAAKRIAGDRMTVEADIFADGHDQLSARLLYRREEAPTWSETPMELLVNDRWRGEFIVPEIGRYRYALRGWVDLFKTWRYGMERWLEAGETVPVELKIGADLVDRASERAADDDSDRLRAFAGGLRRGESAVALDPELAELMDRHPDTEFAVTYDPGLVIEVDRPRAGFGAWYEMFPRSASSDPDRAGTLRDVESRIPYVASMGFDVLYLPPIHPIGRTKRKGKNNAVVAEKGAPGSPWAIGAVSGGHKAIDPALGTMDDFQRLLATARRYGIEIAMDAAFQASPDHPYVVEHLEWFRVRPDGMVQYAENPPKRYEDIYPFNFENHDWRGLWAELESVFEFWIDQGVRIFRVDNPHTKPFAFWAWLIERLKRRHPDVILLSEAFTRPKVMYQLAKLGFTQSYTYFTWRRAKWELEEYFTELNRPPVRDFFRPNLWPNTPDILTEQLQYGTRATFQSRLVLAATLSANYGIYGPAFELMEQAPAVAGKEEYLNSEKYEVRHWNLDQPDSLHDFIARVNRIRRDNPALKANQSLQFHRLDNEQLIAYSKITEDAANIILTIVNMDAHNRQSGWVEMPLERFKLGPDEAYQVHDLLSGAYYLWHGDRNYVELHPDVVPAHIFSVRRRARTERDFDGFA